MIVTCLNQFLLQTSNYSLFVNIKTCEFGRIIMKRCIIFFQIVGFCLLVKNSLAQDNIDEAVSAYSELTSIQVSVDQKLITDWTGVRRYVKLRDFSVSFDSTSKWVNKEQYSKLIISRAKITLIRNDKSIAFTTWREGGAEPLNTFYTVVQLGDRYEMQLTLTAQRKNGEQVLLRNKLIYNLPLL